MTIQPIISDAGLQLFADCKTEMSGPLCFPGVSGSHFWPIVSDVMWGLFVRAALACVTFG